MIKKVLFLYSELSVYTINCINYFAVKNSEVSIYIVHWDINKEAPFILNFDSSVFAFKKKEINLLSLLKKVEPDLILCSGWLDKEYINVIKHHKNSFSTVLLFDNYWEDTLRQKLGSFIFKNTIKKFFDFCWVPGDIHLKYASKLGFNKENIFFGFYATNLDFFNRFYKKNINSTIPKKFFYVGRYLKLKGVQELWDAFLKFSEKFPDWELNCIGSGELFESKTLHPKIIHHGFVQQNELDLFLKSKGVFIMPSHFDHWGVAVQEFSSAGMPLILSDKVGSGCAFLQDGKNGFSFIANNTDDLLDKMIQIAELPQKKLCKFGIVSHELSNLYNLSTWNNTLINIINKSCRYD